MKVCTHKNIALVILTRNEHCPSHVHAGTSRWDARFTFSYWHNGVSLWDVTPMQNEPRVDVLETLRQVLKQPLNLRRARELWWSSRQTLCLDRQLWDPVMEEVVSPKSRRPGTLAIERAWFDPSAYRTVLQLAGLAQPLEIHL